MNAHSIRQTKNLNLGMQHPFERCPLYSILNSLLNDERGNNRFEFLDQHCTIIFCNDCWQEYTRVNRMDHVYGFVTHTLSFRTIHDLLIEIPGCRAAAFAMNKRSAVDLHSTNHLFKTSQGDRLCTVLNDRRIIR